MHAQVAQHGAVDIELGRKGRAEARAPALGIPGACLVEENVGLERGELLLDHLAADRLDAVEVGDGGLVPTGVIDAPGRAVRPVHPNAIAHLAAQKLVDRHAQALGLGVEQRILDGAQRLRHDAAGARPRRAVELGIDALVLAHGLADDPRAEAVDDGADARRAEALVELAPADDAVLGRELDEVVVAPARVAGKRLDRFDLHCRPLPAMRRRSLDPFRSGRNDGSTRLRCHPGTRCRDPAPHACQSQPMDGSRGHEPRDDGDMRRPTPRRPCAGRARCRRAAPSAPPDGGTWR